MLAAAPPIGELFGYCWVLVIGIGLGLLIAGRDHWDAAGVLLALSAFPAIIVALLLHFVWPVFS